MTFKFTFSLIFVLLVQSYHCQDGKTDQMPKQEDGVSAGGQTDNMSGDAGTSLDGGKTDQMPKQEDGVSAGGQTDNMSEDAGTSSDGGKTDQMTAGSGDSSDIEKKLNKGGLTSWSLSLSPETSMNYDLMRYSMLMQQILQERGEKPITGVIQSMMEMIERLVKMLRTIGELSEMAMGSMMNVGTITLGGMLDDLTRGLSTIPDTLAFRLGNLPSLMGGNMYKSLDEKMRSCQPNMPSMLFTDSFAQGGGCINKHMDEITGDLHNITNTLIDILEISSQGMAQMKDKPLKEIPSSVMSMEKQEMGQLSPLFKKLTKPVGSLLTLLPGVVTCFVKTNYPALKMATQVNYNYLKCMVSDKSKSDDIKKEVQDMISNTRDNWKSSSI